MFHFLKGKSKENVLYAPCKGKVVPLSEVPDPTFSEKILGDGFAVIPSEGKIYAPTDGEIAMVFDTLHALSLIHIFFPFPTSIMKLCSGFFRNYFFRILLF